MFNRRIARTQDRAVRFYFDRWIWCHLFFRFKEFQESDPFHSMQNQDHGISELWYGKRSAVYNFLEVDSIGAVLQVKATRQRSPWAVTGAGGERSRPAWLIAKHSPLADIARSLWMSG